jgi:cation transport ATPase
MATHVQHVRRMDDRAVVDDAPVANREVVRDVVDDSPGVIAARVVWLIAGVILTLLAIRFVFIMLGANPNSGFVNFIYSVSHPFAAPFFGIFGYTQSLGNAKVEWTTLVAMAVYALIAWGIARLLTIRHPRTDV